MTFIFSVSECEEMVYAYGFVTSVKFVLQWNAREVFRIAEYKPEKG
jgi:hypothetical protein